MLPETLMVWLATRGVGVNRRTGRIRRGSTGGDEEIAVLDLNILGVGAVGVAADRGGGAGIAAADDGNVAGVGCDSTGWRPYGWWSKRRSWWYPSRPR